MATPYRAKIAPTAVTQLKALPSKQRKQIIKTIETLAINPRPLGAQKIEGMTGLYVEVVTPLRVIYKIEDQDILILVIK